MLYIHINVEKKRKLYELTSKTFYIIKNIRHKTFYSYDGCRFGLVSHLGMESEERKL